MPTAEDRLKDKLHDAVIEAIGPITHHRFRQLCDEAWLEAHEEAARAARDEVQRDWKKR